MVSLKTHLKRFPCRRVQRWRRTIHFLLSLRLTLRHRQFLVLNAQTLDLKTFSGFEKTGQCILGDVYLAFVHELQESSHVRGRGTIQDDQKVLVQRCSLEQIRQMFAACRQN